MPDQGYVEPTPGGPGPIGKTADSLGTWLLPWTSSHVAAGVPVMLLPGCFAVKLARVAAVEHQQHSGMVS